GRSAGAPPRRHLPRRPRALLPAPPRARCARPRPGRRHVGVLRRLGVFIRCRRGGARPPKMASMRESDTGLWLHNKLGATDELWAPPSIASLLTAAVIDNIRLCFHGLSSAVKLKLLLGTLHLPRRAVDEVGRRPRPNPGSGLLAPEPRASRTPPPAPRFSPRPPAPGTLMKGALTEIIQLATLDTDPWVLMVADILKSFPDTGSLNLDLEEQNPNVQDILGELREKVGECEASAMLPLECQYLNKNALTTLAGPLTPPVKHFQLKRKPKSATLRAELLQKSTETAQQLKRSAGLPLHAKGRGPLRRMDTTRPPCTGGPWWVALRWPEPAGRRSPALAVRTGRALVTQGPGPPGPGHSLLPPAAPLKGIPKQAPFRSPTTPSVFSPAGNRTPIPPSRTPLRKERGVKLLDISELDTVGAGREAKRRRKTLDTDVAEKPAKEETVIENATPDYAAGLVSTQKLGSLNEPALPSTSYLPATPSVVPASSYTPSSEALPAPSSRETSLQAGRPAEEPSAPGPALPTQFKQRAPMYNSGLSPATPAPPPEAPASPLTPTAPPAAAPTAQMPPVAMVTPQAQPLAQQQPKKNLSLTVGVASAPHLWQEPAGRGARGAGTHSRVDLQKEQILAAQEMFKTANKVTRPEKALILGFMAGSRENPCQEQGDVIQIKLSEHTEDLPKSDSQGSTTMLVDTVFEMNYTTGQWTRFKKYKPMANVS
ncbi:Negative elongation factor A, partial [Galemys pyrenaicus]